MAADEKSRRDRYAACIRGLLAELAQTHHASVAYDANERHIEDLSCALARMPDHIASLDKLREASLKKHKTSRDSLLRRFAFRIIGQAGRFESDADQQRQCYYDVLRQEHQAKEEERRLREQHARATRIVQGLEPAALRHREVQEELDDLFAELFAGAQNGDDQEHAALGDDVESARQTWREAQEASERARLAVALMSAAAKDAQQALGEVGTALDRGTLDGGYAVAKKHLRQAHAHARAAQRQCRQARRVAGPAAAAAITMAVPDATYHAAQGYRQSGAYAPLGFRDLLRRYRGELEAGAGGLQGELARLGAWQAAAAAESGRCERALARALARRRAAHTRAFLKMVGKEAWPAAGTVEAVAAEGPAPPAYRP